MHSTPTEGVTCLEIIQMKMMMKTSKGTSINHVDGFLGIFNPPPPKVVTSFMDGPLFIYLITVVLNLRRGSSRNPTGHSQRKDASKHDQFDRDLHIVVHTQLYVLKHTRSYYDPQLAVQNA